MNLNGQVGSEIKSWSVIKSLPDEQQTAIQSQMRAVYTACSRARDVLYVISDLKSGTPMEEILSNGKESATHLKVVGSGNAIAVKSPIKKQLTKRESFPSVKEKILDEVVDHAIVKALILDTKKETTIKIDVSAFPNQKKLLKKHVGETFKLPGVSLTYKIIQIVASEILSVETGKKMSLKEYFISKGFAVLDYREKHGCLWILGERKALEPYVDEVERIYKATGGFGAGKASGYKSAWWTKSNM